jgi:hypothetical protein
MPTRLPDPPVPIPARPAPALPAIVSAWLAGLIVLAAVAGATDGHGRCAAPAVGAAAGRPTVPVSDDGPATAVRDMLAHD